MKVVYYIVFLFWYLLSLLPLRFLYIFSDVLYYPLYYCIRYRRKVVRQNLTGSFPDKNEKELIRIEKQYYHFFCDYMIETIKLFSISKKQLKRRMTFGGIDEIVKKLEEENKNFCFIYLGHYCNWEWIASLPYWVPEDILCGQIYHPLYNKAFDPALPSPAQPVRRRMHLDEGDAPPNHRIETRQAENNHRLYLRPSSEVEQHPPLDRLLPS